MTRMLTTLTAAVALLPAAPAIDRALSTKAPAVVGAERPVFLGRMVVAATPLPDGAAARPR